MEPDRWAALPEDKKRALVAKQKYAGAAYRFYPRNTVRAVDEIQVSVSGVEMAPLGDARPRRNLAPTPSQHDYAKEIMGAYRAPTEMFESRPQGKGSQKDQLRRLPGQKDYFREDSIAWNWQVTNPSNPFVETQYEVSDARGDVRAVGYKLEGSTNVDYWDNYADSGATFGLPEGGRITSNSEGGTPRQVPYSYSEPSCLEEQGNYDPGGHYPQHYISNAEWPTETW